jgi:hypothetical protein
MEEAVVSYWKEGPGNFLEGLQKPQITSAFEDETGHLLNTLTYFTYRSDIFDNTAFNFARLSLSTRHSLLLSDLGFAATRPTFSDQGPQLLFGLVCGPHVYKSQQVVHLNPYVVVQSLEHT